MPSAAIDSAQGRSTKKKEKPWSHPDREYEVKDAMHTLMRAGEIVGDKALMAEVKKHAAEHAGKMKDVARQADALAKRGHISPKAYEKLSRR